MMDTRLETALVKQLKADDINCSDTPPFPQPKPLVPGAHAVVFSMWGTIPVAVKRPRVPINDVKNHLRQDFQHEAAIHVYLGRHKNVVPFLRFVVDPPMILMDIVGAGKSFESVFFKHDCLSISSRVNFTRVCDMCIGAAEGLRHLHAMGVIHRDVSTHNFIVGADVRISDFRTAVLLPKNVARTTTVPDEGSVRIMSPEAYDMVYHRPGDVFSFGNLLWEVFARVHSFCGIDKMHTMRLVLRGARPPIVDGWPDKLKSLITRCTLTDPDARPTIEQVVSDLTAIRGIGTWLPTPLRDCYVTGFIHSTTLVNVVNVHSLMSVATLKQPKVEHLDPESSIPCIAELVVIETMPVITGTDAIAPRSRTPDPAIAARRSRNDSVVYGDVVVDVLPSGYVDDAQGDTSRCNRDICCMFFIVVTMVALVPSIFYVLMSY
jgi:serine/threonine protein kinase